MIQTILYHKKHATLVETLHFAHNYLHFIKQRNS